MKKITTLFAVVALTMGTANASSEYDTEHGIGLGLIEYYGNHCKELSSKGRKIARATDKLLKIKNRHYQDYKDGYETGEFLGCTELKNIWKEDANVYKWTQLFFNGL